MSGPSQQVAAPPGGVAPVSRRVMNLAHFLVQAARRHPARAALVCGEARLSWRELDARTAALARALAEHGVGKGDRVLVHARNSFAFAETLFAVLRLGAVWVPTNCRISPDEAVYLARAAGVKAFLCEGQSPAHAAAVAQAMPDLALLARLGPGEFGAADTASLIDARLQDAPAACVDVDYDDPCWFFFTSGTTGHPKAAVLTHGQMAFVLTNHLCDLMPGTTEHDVSLVVAPLSHGAGIHFLTQVARAAATVLPEGERFDPEEAWRLVQAHRVTNMFTVPTIVKLLVEHPAVDAFDHTSLRYVIYAGAPMYREDQKRALAKLGRVLVQYFGLGEVTGNITVLPPAQHHDGDGPEARVGTCGYERIGMQVSIQDEAGNPLPAGRTGEICVCGPAVFAGYYDNPAANAKAFRNGWFRTGDLGYQDDAGYLYITGRESDMYISGGSNIYPREVEEKVLAHPAVAEAAVLGVPDPVWGEVGVMVCVLRPGETLEEEALLAWLGSRMARYKLPRQVFFWDALPRSGYGKITKKLVREALRERGCLAPA
ncbi:acyl-CoA synthetase [Achromobacter xylosoxidans]|uniref:acyl-CoA synthetase n=2 Tax=Alcaligenes xylosoxydans xylosoxydans TaxID=85698 RepID=UPI00064E0978|nr:acyl-CoA synthetase [Achromobacter xylosoxidans]KMJ88716.1 acyl-CoA synthetase [Achromobacter xylosoxidans]MCH4576937.1 acyl-CoA synthetase [Achromobacter xylosoxidans]OFO68616.1 acyl-CoA synthetase [Achromobacter xylosoxidans]OMG79833.1 acyl-CoA synthetase [Achromobacter xylosoxidans]PNL97957.1 acyl-CoA synthetase [Achromobacter xylosoxidans]